MIEIIECRPNNPMAIPLIKELSSILNTITGDSGTSSFNMETFEPERDSFIVIKKDNTAVACGSIRCVNNNTCEMKRVYSKVKGLGLKTINILEKKAKEHGYTQIILSTRKVNTNAVNFYLKNGYIEIAPYGKYKTTNVSICLGKNI